MHITGLARGYPDPAAPAKRNQPLETAAARPSETPSSQTAPATASAAVLRQIVARYDVTDISPREFSEMVHQLHQAGALTDQQFQELSLIRLDLDLDGADPDESLDLLDFYADKLRDLREMIEDLRDDLHPTSAGAPPGIASVESRFAWIQKFALIQSGPDAIAWDATV